MRKFAPSDQKWFKDCKSQPRSAKPKVKTKTEAETMQVVHLS